MGVAGAVLAVLAGSIAWYCAVVARRRHGVGPEGLAAELQPQFTSLRSFQFSANLLWGELDEDLYPPLIEPRYVSAAEASGFLRDDDLVAVVQGREAAFVYPVFMMSAHHAANVIIDFRPLAVTTCQLSGSCAVYSRAVAGRNLTLGVTGLLYGGNSVLFDRETDTRWLQMNGEALQGLLVGHRLEHVARTEVSTWGSARRNPQVKVLAPVYGIPFYRRFYEGIEKERFGLKVVSSAGGRRDPRLPPYARGLGIIVRGEKRFFSVERLKTRGIENEVVGGWGILAVYDREHDTARIYRRFLDGRRLRFREAKDGGLRDVETGSQWNGRGECVAGELDGRRLEMPAYTEVYWFSWSTIYPRSSVSRASPARSSRSAGLERPAARRRAEAPEDSWGMHLRAGAIAAA